MKRLVFLTWVIFFTISLSSCNFRNNEQLQPENELGTDVQEKYNVISKNLSKTDEELSYKINYPQISGLVDTDKEKRINEIIQEEALKVLNYYSDPFGNVEINIDYKITLASNILSIQYSGLGTVQNAAHPNKFFYTTNVDIKQGKRIRLVDIVNTNVLAEKFIKGKFQALSPEQAEEIEIEQMDLQELQQNFKEADSLDNIDTDEQSDVYSYFTEDSLGISIPVPYALGGHAEFEIKYDDLRNDFFKKELVEGLLNNNK